MELKSTLTTTESGAFTVPFVDVSAVGTFLRGVPGVYEKCVLPKGLSFVPKELLKLVERPIVELPVELRTSPLLDSDFA